MGTQVQQQQEMFDYSQNGFDKSDRDSTSSSSIVDNDGGGSNSDDDDDGSGSSGHDDNEGDAMMGRHKQPK